ncbi:MAG: hypothetical protein AAFO76_16385, partial [Cyanobacteria bacterium J06607_15]
SSRCQKSDRSVVMDEQGSALPEQSGNKVGEQLFNPIVQVERNPAHPLLQSDRFFGNGLSNNQLDIIKNGISQTLSYIAPVGSRCCSFAQ